MSEVLYLHQSFTDYVVNWSKYSDNIDMLKYDSVGYMPKKCTA